MRALLNTIFAGMLTIGVASCSKESDLPMEVPAPPVTLTARIADETKATLDEESGAFAFTAADAIKVCNDSGVYSSTGTTITDGIATFTMSNGFSDSGTGLAAFPAGIVTAMTKTSVTFTLPTTYAYSQVGGLTPAPDANASNAMVPCPMISDYTAGSELYFKQAGAVVRFRITDSVAGDITFTFTSPVTGSVTLNAIPSGTDGGILAANLSSAGYSITVTGVPEVTAGNYIFITLPVPTGTDPLNVGVWTHGTSMNKVATLSNITPISLNRAGGYKRGVSLTNVKNAATFDGKFLAGDLYYDGSSTYSIIEDPLEMLKYYQVDYTTNKWYFNWDFLNKANFRFTIGRNKYRVPSSGLGGDWSGIAGTKSGRPMANVKGINTRYAFLTVTGLDSGTYHTSSVGGLILFPDNALIAVPSGAKLDVFDADDDGNNNTISLGGLRSLLNQGCSFFPTSGYWNQSKWYTLYWGRGWYGINEAGSYWSDSAYNSDHAYALTILRNHTTYEQPNLIDPSAHDQKDLIYLPVRLVKVL